METVLGLRAPLTMVHFAFGMGITAPYWRRSKRPGSIQLLVRPLDFADLVRESLLVIGLAFLWRSPLPSQLPATCRSSRAL